VRDERRPSFARLTLVELRKATDTRAGFWLQVAVLALGVLVMLISALTGHDSDHQLRQLFSDTAQAVNALLPVVGILLVSSEWSQRTAQITFSLVPRRERVIAAKLGAGVILALAAFVVSLLLALLGTAIAGSSLPHTWHLPLAQAGQVLFYLVVNMAIGVAFGALLLSSAPAIVSYFLVPIGIGALGTINAIQDVFRWFDQSSLVHITERLLSGNEWARTGTSLAFWMLLPLLIGSWRILRSDIN
jgi:ABC-2 type transport system permease protein